MKAYTVEYKMFFAGNVNNISFLARNKEEAYEKAVYTYSPEKHGTLPYSAWVTSVTFQNGNYKAFNTFEGKPL